MARTGTHRHHLHHASPPLPSPHRHRAPCRKSMQVQRWWRRAAPASLPPSPMFLNSRSCLGRHPCSRRWQRRLRGLPDFASQGPDLPPPPLGLDLRGFASFGGKERLPFAPVGWGRSGRCRRRHHPAVSMWTCRLDASNGLDP